MSDSKRICNGVVALRRAAAASSRQLEGTRRGLSSMRAVQQLGQRASTAARPWTCENCRRHRVVSSSPSESLFQPLQATHKNSSRSIQSSSSPKSWHAAPAQPPTSHPDTTIPLPEQLRSIMRLLTHSVVVCTSRHDSIPRAMTMSSFTSLTLSPTPLVTFNIATPSRTYDAIAESGIFNIHVLAGDTEGAAVASHFTRGNINDHVLDGLESVTCDEQCVLRGPGILFALRCRILGDAAQGGLVRVRDHVIVIGEVLEMVPVNEKEQFGLAYADRKYRQVGGVLEDE